MDESIQYLVDDLASRIVHSVAIDDTESRLIAYSPHYGQIDDLRLESILHREAPGIASELLRQQGVDKAEEPVRIDPNGFPGVLPRICAPIRFQRLLFGYLWVIDADSSLSQDEITLIGQAAERAGAILYRETMFDTIAFDREQELVRDLLSEDDVLRSRAADQLIEGDLFPPTGSPQVIVAQLSHPDGLTLGAQEKIALDSAIQSARRRVPHGHAVQTVKRGQAILVVVANDPAWDRSAIDLVSARLRERIVAAVDARYLVHVGIGEPSEDLPTTFQSYRQAVLSIRVASAVPDFGRICEWRQIGIYRCLAQLPNEALDLNLINSGLRDLLTEPKHSELLLTLERFLENAGNAGKTAEDLDIHRTSLYYRLGRIEQLAEVNLRTGHERLTLHLGLKLAAFLEPEQVPLT